MTPVLPEIIIYILDLTGCVAAAAAASMLAKRVGFDFVGGVMVAAVAAIGGGTARDIMINRYPIFWLHNLSYMVLITFTAIVVRIFYYSVENRFDKPLRLFDALGLSAFAIIGFEAALSKSLPYPSIILMGVITSSMGGVMRDMICGQLPLILRREFYIMCVITGGIIYLLLLTIGIDLWLRDILSLLFIFVMRMLAIYRNWNIPNITLPHKNN